MHDDINNNWTAWKDLLFAAVNEYILKHKAKRKPNVPWITKELNVLCRKKKSLYKKAKRNKKEQNWINYRKLNNMLKKECNSARWEHINNLVEELKENNNAKPFWSYVKSKCKGTNNLVLLKVGDSMITDDASIAESMNSYFSSVFTSKNYGNFPDMDHVINTKQ